MSDRYTIILTVAKIAEDGSEIETVALTGTKYASTDQEHVEKTMYYFQTMIDDDMTTDRHWHNNDTITCVLPEEEEEDLASIAAEKEYEDLPW